MAEAVNEVIVHHACGLHEGITDDGSDKAKAAVAQIPAHHLRLFGLTRDLGETVKPVTERVALNEAPDVPIKRAELVPEIEKSSGVMNSRFDLAPIPDEPRISKEPAYVSLAVAGNAFRVKVGKGAAEMCAFRQYKGPAKPRLHGLKHQHFK